MRLWHCYIALGAMIVVVVLTWRALNPPLPQCRAPANALDRGVCAEL